MNILDDMMLINSESVTLSVKDGEDVVHTETCTYNVYWDDGYGRYALITQGKLASCHPKYNKLLAEVAKKNMELMKGFDAFVKPTGNSIEEPKNSIILLERSVEEDVEALKVEHQSKNKDLKKFVRQVCKSTYSDHEVFAEFDNIIVTDKAILIAVFDEEVDPEK